MTYSFNSKKVTAIFIFLLLCSSFLVWGAGSSSSSSGGTSSSGSSSVSSGTSSSGSSSVSGGNSGSSSGSGASSSGNGNSGSTDGGSGNSSDGGEAGDSGGDNSSEGDNSTGGDYSPSTISGISSAASSGGNLSGYSIGQLSATIDSLSGTAGNEKTISIIQAEIDSRHNAIDAEVQAAENDLSECMKTLTQKQAEYDEFDAAYSENFNKMFIDREYFTLTKEEQNAVLANVEESQKKITEYTKSIENAQKKVSEACNKYNEVTKKAAEFYASYESAGDPVNISTGDFIYSTEDFIAQDYLEKFIIKRKLSSSGVTESFGKNWECSLDSRILRCRFRDVNDLISDNEKKLIVIDESLKAIEEYNTKHPRFPSTELDELEQQWSGYKTMTENLLTIFYQIKTENDKADEKNVYASYGRYSSKDHIYGTKNTIKYLDEEGNEYAFLYSANGKWIPAAEIVKGIEIYGRKSDGAVATDNDNSGGFLVSYKNGKKIYYDSYGLLEKEIDSNGNQTVFNKTKGRVSSIKLKTSETIQIKRNSSNYITLISGNVSGNATYVYSGSSLVSVVNNENLKYGYAYDSTGLLSKITKADGNNISIKHENNSKMGKKVVSKIINENGDAENFSYKPEDKTFYYTNSIGIQTKYIYNENGNTIYVEVPKGKIIKFSNNTNGLVSGINEDGCSRTFSYDSYNQINKVAFNNGAEVSVEYDKFGKIQKQRDSDGFYLSFDCDSKGNVIAVYYCGSLISTCTYYSNGLLKSVMENGCTYFYKYNNYGSITERKVINNESETYEEKYFYDEKNRLTKYVDFIGRAVTYAYGDSSRTENYYDLREVKRFFDKRNREIRLVEKDLITGKSYEKTTVYDGCGNVLKIFFDGELFTEYDYDSCGRKISFTVWNFNQDDCKYFVKQGLKTEYEYDSLGFVISEKKSVLNADYSDSAKKKFSLKEDSFSFVQRNIYKNNNKKSVIECRGNCKTEYHYDEIGRLKKIIENDGFWKSFTYSKAGRLLTVEDSNGKKIINTYRNNGTKKTEIINEYGKKAFYDHDILGRLILSSDFEENQYSYFYDWNGYIKKISSPNCIKNYVYDCYGNLLSWNIKDLQEKILYNEVYERNLSANTLIVLHSGKKNSQLFFDCWNRPVKIIDKNGIQEFEYDVLGNCVQSLRENNVQKYYYTPEGKLSLCINSDNSYVLNQFDVDGRLVTGDFSGLVKVSNKYNASGWLEEESDFYGNVKTYKYKNGELYSISRNDCGEIFYDLNKSGRYLSIKNGDGMIRTLTIEKGGAIKKEELNSGEMINFYYDQHKNSQRNVFNSGQWEEISFDKKNGLKKISYSNGDFSEVVSNPLGNVRKASTGKSCLSFEYDDCGQLISQFDENLNICIKNEYDDLGRKVRTFGKQFDFCYEYDNYGNIASVFDDVSQNKVIFEYDCMGREILREYLNGIKIISDYDKAGRKVLKCGISNNGEIIFCNIIIYDEDGKIQWEIKEKGIFQKYEYDEQGRLQNIFSFPSDEKIVFFENEYINCGGYLKSQNLNLQKIFFDDNVKWKIESILAKNKLTNKIIIPFYQECWWEKYTYTKSGSVKTTETPVGKIVYEYDVYNRLKKKHVSETESAGENYFWDDDGRLLRKESERFRTELKYDTIDKPVYIRNDNLISGDSVIKEFVYDALGRIIEICNNKKDRRHFIYEGSSRKILYSVPVMENNNSADLYSLENEGLQDFEKIVIADSNYEKNYRITGDTDFSEYESYKVKETGEKDFQTDMMKLTDNYENQNISNSGEIYSVLSIGEDSSYICIYSDSKKVSYNISDYHNNSCGIFNEASDYNFSYETNSWGNFYSDDGEFHYKGSYFYLGTNLFDFGDRVYSSDMKSFLSEDKKRDGGNYYAYCATDPVNYYDEDGNFKRGSKKSQNMLYAGAIAAFTGYSQHKMKTLGSEMGIPKSYNCADVSAVIDAVGSKASGQEHYSPMADSFSEAYFDGNHTKAMDSTQSKDYYSDNSGKNVSKTSSGLENLTNPEIVTPGTVLVWSPDPAKGIETGHTATVVSRDFDGEGNITGIVMMEGHLSENNYTEVEYVYVGDTKSDVKNNHYNIKAWRGNYEGTYEIESSDYATENTSCGG